MYFQELVEPICEIIRGHVELLVPDDGRMREDRVVSQLVFHPRLDLGRPLAANRATVRFANTRAHCLLESGTQIHKSIERVHDAIDAEGVGNPTLQTFKVRKGVVARTPATLRLVFARRRTLRDDAKRQEGKESVYRLILKAR